MVNRTDEIGTMIHTTQKVVNGFRQKTNVANAIGKGNYNIKIPLLSSQDKLGKALEQMRNNLQESKISLEHNLKSLEEYAINLEKKNKELDQFAYITSHDLKSPLRGINNLAEWIMEDLGDNIPVNSKQYFGLLQGRVHRMEALINSILTYSRAGKLTDKQELVSTKETLINTLDYLQPNKKFRIFFDENLPSIFGNKKDIKDLFYIFISNAIIHNTAKNPVINITFSTNKNGFTFCIADNGPGINPEYHEKIFTIFQTLESRDKIESVGAGLAIAKKIVESYGGKTWVESDEGLGANFYFTWINPKNKVEEENTTPKKPKILTLN